MRDAAHRSSAASAPKNAITPQGLRTILISRLETASTPPQKTSVAAGPNALPAGTAKARAPPVLLGPADRLRPLNLHVRPGRAVEERRPQLTPAALEPEPREVGEVLGPLARNGRDGGHGSHDGGRSCRRSRRPAAALRTEEEPLVEEVGVRAGGRVHDRVRPVDDLELVTRPTPRVRRPRCWL